MRYLDEVTHYHSYDRVEESIYEKIDRNTAFESLRTRASTGRAFSIWIDTSFKASILRTKHVMVVDCDNETGMIAAAHIIKSVFQKEYEIVQSSEGHFWLITDIVGTFNNVMKYFDLIVGVDPKYSYFTKQRERFHLRLHPKNNSIPQFHNKRICLQNPEAIRFYQQLKKDYTSKDMRMILEVFKVQQLWAKGKLIDAAANPEFSI